MAAYFVFARRRLRRRRGILPHRGAGRARGGARMKFHHAQVETLNFATLDGWKDDDHAAAFETYMKSCGAILKAAGRCARRGPSMAGCTMPARKRPLAAGGTVERAQARKFFEDNFKPVRILPEVHTYGYYTGAEGFYTGYYETEVAGSRVRPRNSVCRSTGCRRNVAGKKSKVFSQFARTEIEKGALAGKGLEIC